LSPSPPGRVQQCHFLIDKDPAGFLSTSRHRRRIVQALGLPLLGEKKRDQGGSRAIHLSSLAYYETRDSVVNNKTPSSFFRDCLSCSS
jgi:hypothetical protein